LFVRNVLITTHCKNVTQSLTYENLKSVDLLCQWAGWSSWWRMHRLFHCHHHWIVNFWTILARRLTTATM